MLNGFYYLINKRFIYINRQNKHLMNFQVNLFHNNIYHVFKKNFNCLL